MSTKPVVVVFVQGFGLGNDDSSNPFFKANTPFFNKAFEKNQVIALKSQVFEGKIDDKSLVQSGYFQIGFGIEYEPIDRRIQNSIKSKNLQDNEVLCKFFTKAKYNDTNCHIVVDLDDLWILENIVDVYSSLGFNPNKLIIHFVVDTSLAQTEILQSFSDGILSLHKKKISSISSIIPKDIFSAEKIENLENVLKVLIGKDSEELNEWKDFFNKKNFKSSNAFSVLNYDTKFDPINHEDSMFFLNKDLGLYKEVIKVFSDSKKLGNYKNLRNLNLLMLQEDDDCNLDYIFSRFRYFNSLSEIIALNNLKQLKVFSKQSRQQFINSFQDQMSSLFAQEDWLEIGLDKQNNDLQDLKSEIDIIFKKSIEKIQSNSYDAVFLNITSLQDLKEKNDFKATVELVETLDERIRLLTDAVLDLNGSVIVTSPNPGIEQMYQKEINSENLKINPTVFLVYNKFGPRVEKTNGNFIDFAPTVLKLLGLEKPASMIGQSLI